MATVFLYVNNTFIKNNKVRNKKIKMSYTWKFLKTKGKRIEDKW